MSRLDSSRSMTTLVKVFGCRPMTDGATNSSTWGPAFENLQGRKSREVTGEAGVARYGDLAAAGGAADGGRWGRAGQEMRLIDEIGLSW
jgi:hypothetical protein